MRAASTAALLGVAVILVAAEATELSGASFSATSSNPGNSFGAATSFEKIRVASGTYSGNNTNNRAITGVGFQPDVVIVKANATQVAVVRTSTMTGDASKPMTGASGLATGRIKSLDADGFTLGTHATVNASSTTYYWIALKAATAELKVGTYNGNGTSQSIGGFGFSPEYVATLSAGAHNAIMRFQGMTRSFRFDANTGTTTGITSLDANGFSVGGDSQANASGTAYHYLAFNEVSGRIDTGTYTGNNADNRNITGVGFQPQYVLTRPNDTATGRPGMHRPGSLAGDSTLRFNNAANAPNNIQALQADGFQLGGSADVNFNGVTYHYLALRDGGP
jgi:hypothetical protein